MQDTEFGAGEHRADQPGTIPRSFRLLRIVRESVAESLLPELQSDGARDVAKRIDMVLADLIVREERTPALLVEQIKTGEALVRQGRMVVGEQAPIQADAGESSTEQSFAILSDRRGRIAAALEALIERSSLLASGSARAFEDAAAAWERSFLDQQTAPPDEMKAEVAPLPPVTASAFQAYLAETDFLPGSSTVKSVETVAGGYSKGIFRFAVENSELGPMALVMRRNQGEPIDPTGCFLQDVEFTITRALHRAGVRLPRPWHFEPAGGRFGGEVTIMDHAPGRLYGDVLSAAPDLSDEMLRDLASVLAHLHRLRLTDLEPEISVLQAGETVETIAQANHAMLDHHERYWRKNRLVPSPLVARAFGWLRRHLPTNDGPVRVIHGDYGLNNILFDKGRVSAVLDWETCQLGDPAYELAYLRAPLETRSLWEPFLAAYREAGGQPATEESLAFHRAARWLRNAAFSTVSSGRFDAGTWNSLPVATLAVSVRPAFMKRADDFARD
ncbi:phosphotransferase family protein [Sphingomonas sp.]|uniref:phosphotransferase family protein n=1 Tax=Sphingomonas sp. TaxID=28214 RepID=UPI003AFFC13F